MLLFDDPDNTYGEWIVKVTLGVIGEFVAIDYGNSPLL